MITSESNQYFKLYKSLKLKKYRDQHQLFLVYGHHMIELAKKKGDVVEIITSNSDKEGTLFDEKLFKELQTTESYIDQIAVCKKLNQSLTSKKILMLDDVQDPDNVGALIRSAVAFGFLHIILSPHSADLYNEKVIRASKGAIFDCMIERKPLVEAIQSFKDKKYQILYADAHEKGNPVKKDHIVLVLGNEGHGIREEIKALSDCAVHIQTNYVESLNVSIAGSILMYEWSKL